MPTVTNTVKYPNGTIAAGRVSIDLVGENGRPLRDGAWVSGSDYAVESSYDADLATSAPSWSVTLVANDLINPAGTRWRVQEHVNGRPNTYYLNVPDGAGPYFAEDILDEAPASIASSALQAHINQSTVVYWSGSVVRGVYDDGATDQSDAWERAMDALGTTGGELIFGSPGTVRIDSQIVIPNDGASPTGVQPTIKISGAGGYPNGRSLSPSGGTILDLRYAGTKIVTLGGGFLELSSLTLRDTTDGTGNFILSTNTTLHLRAVTFFGKTATNPTQDAIVLGGTTAVTGSGEDNGFQGYGTIVEGCYFNRVRRAVYGRTWCNAVVVRDNTVWTSCGFSTGAAFELAGISGNACSGNLFAGNLVECTNYKYAFKSDYALGNNFISNNLFDAGAGLTGFYRFETNAQSNLIVAGYYDASKTLVSNAAADDRITALTSLQSQTSRFTEPVYFRNDVTFQNVPVNFASNVNAILSAQGTGNMVVRGGTGAGGDVRLDVANAASAYVDRVRLYRNGGGHWKDTSGNILIEQGVNTLGFYGATPTAKPTGVAVTAAAIHAALVSLGLIGA